MIISLEEDRETVARVLAGDKAAFSVLIERHRASALAFSRRMLDANEAEDAVQEAFLAALTARPSTFDLTTHLLELSGAKIEKVAVTELRDNVYIGTMWLKAGGNKFEVAARPSDAIMLALHGEASIYLASEILEGNRTVVSADDERVKWKTLEQNGPPEPEAQPMEYTSVRGLVHEALTKPASD